MTMIYDPIPLSSFKNFSWKLRTYYGYLRENIYYLHNLQMLFML